jgi:hypothetical protein
LEALRMIEKEYASSEVDRAEDLRSEMKDLDPEHFVVGFGEYMEGILQIQSKSEVIGKPVEDSMVRVFIRDKAPSELKAFIATISRDGSLNLDDWVMEIQKFDRTLHKGESKSKKKVKDVCIASYTNPKSPSTGLIETCQLCGGIGHKALECKRWIGEKRSCYNCGERGHLSRDCTKPRQHKKVDQAEENFLKAKKAFKAAKVKAHKASKKKLVKSPKSTSSSSSEDGVKSNTDEYEDSSSSSSTSSSSSDDGHFGIVGGKKAKVVYGKKAKKTYLEATSPTSVSSSDSHLSREEYNLKSAKGVKLTRSRSWDGAEMSNKEKMDKLSF